MVENVRSLDEYFEEGVPPEESVIDILEAATPEGSLIPILALLGLGRDRGWELVYELDHVDVVAHHRLRAEGEVVELGRSSFYVHNILVKTALTVYGWRSVAKMPTT
jgi:hypothetical protein